METEEIEENSIDESDVEEEENEKQDDTKNEKKEIKQLLDNMDDILAVENLDKPIGITTNEEDENEPEDEPEQQEPPKQINMNDIYDKIRSQIQLKPVKVPVFKEPKKQKLNVNRAQMISELLLFVNELKMDTDRYNAKFFDSLSDAELMDFKLSLIKTVDKKMTTVLSKDPKFISKMIIKMCGVPEAIMPKYLKGYAGHVESQKQELEECIQRMIEEGKLEKIKALMKSEYQLALILGGSALMTITDNVKNTTQNINRKVEETTKIIIDDVKKKPFIVPVSSVPVVSVQSDFIL